MGIKKTSHQKLGVSTNLFISRKEGKYRRKSLAGTSRVIFSPHIGVVMSKCSYYKLSYYKLSDGATEQVVEALTS